MPTNQNTFNSRITSESFEKKFRDTFPAQGGAGLPDDLYASGVVVPVIDFSSAVEGSQLPEFLQTAWDFSTISTQTVNTTSSIVATPGFYYVQGTGTIEPGTGTAGLIRVFIDDGVTSKNVWGLADKTTSTVLPSTVTFTFNVYLRSGDTLKAQSNGTTIVIDTFVRQIADVNGNLVNPLGFTSS